MEKKETRMYEENSSREKNVSHIQSRTGARAGAEAEDDENASRSQSRKDVFFILYCGITYKFCKFEIIKVRLNFLLAARPFQRARAVPLVTLLRFFAFRSRRRFARISRLVRLYFEFSSSAFAFRSDASRPSFRLPPPVRRFHIFSAPDLEALEL